MAKTSVKYTCECGKSLRLAQEKLDSGKLKCPKCGNPIVKGGGAKRAKTEDKEKRSKSKRKKSRKPDTEPPPDIEDEEEPDEPEDEEEDEEEEEDEQVEEEEEEEEEEEAAASFEEDDDSSDEMPAVQPKSERKSTGRHTSSRKAVGGGGGAVDRGARARQRTGTAGLSRVAGLSTMLSGLMFIACAIIAGYFVHLKGGAVMVSNQTEAYGAAVFFGMLGLISAIVLWVAGKLARGLCSVYDAVDDVRVQLKD